jgi:hypothetical protein
VNLARLARLSGLYVLGEKRVSGAVSLGTLIEAVWGAVWKDSGKNYDALKHTMDRVIERANATEKIV